jgi:hypothetical protein
MADKLVVECEDYDTYRIYWWIEEDGDIGGSVGDHEASESRREKLLEKIRSSSPPREDDIGSLECCVADLAAAKSVGAIRDSNGYRWTSKAQAMQAVREVRAAVKAVRLEMKTGRKEPDWAIKARAAGWKPPKGWAP